MTDKQKREKLIDIDHDYFGDFSDEDWDLWFGAAKEGFMEKFAVMLAECWAALEEIIAECPEPKTAYGRKVVEIARNGVKGGE